MNQNTEVRLKADPGPGVRPEGEKPGHGPVDGRETLSQLGEAEKDSTTPPNNSTADKSEDELEYITGIKLGLVLTSMTVVFFLMMLDGSILSTVSTYQG